MNRKRNRHSNTQRAANAAQGLKTSLKTTVKTSLKLRRPRQGQSSPVKAALSANKGSDLLLLCSNNRHVARPQLLRDGDTVYLRRKRS